MGKVKNGFIKAAGGLVVRKGEEGLEILLVHRPNYLDWSFPKGKNDEGESFKKCALREVREETGLTCELGREVVGSFYTVGGGKTKVVRYWEMDPIKGDFEPHGEIDKIRWLSLKKARKKLTYERDVAVLDTYRAVRK